MRSVHALLRNERNLLRPARALRGILCIAPHAPAAILRCDHARVRNVVFYGSRSTSESPVAADHHVGAGANDVVGAVPKVTGAVAHGSHIGAGGQAGAQTTGWGAGVKARQHPHPVAPAVVKIAIERNAKVFMVPSPYKELASYRLRQRAIGGSHGSHLLRPMPKRRRKLAASKLAPGPLAEGGITIQTTIAALR